MGQYYKIVNLSNNIGENVSEYITPDGIKLLEHAWMGNFVMGSVMSLMSPFSKWHKKRIIWAGDYYENENGVSYYSECEGKPEICLYSKIGTPSDDIDFLGAQQQWNSILINHTKKEYVVLKNLPSPNGLNFVIHPLPILCALGNGEGYGDYSDKNPDYDKSGRWAGDILSVDENTEDFFKEYKDNLGFSELTVKFSVDLQSI